MKLLNLCCLVFVVFALASCGVTKPDAVITHEEALVTLTPIPTATLTPTTTPTSTPVPTATATPFRVTPQKIDSDHIRIPLTENINIELIRIPEGEFTMGSTQAEVDAVNKQLIDWHFSSELPQNKVFLKEYWIGKTEVTVGQFMVFAKAANYRTQAERDGKAFVWINNGDEIQESPGSNWLHPLGPSSDITKKIDHPVTYMTWNDALAFCYWLKSISGLDVKLPSEAEWEKAARGTDARIFPWGNTLPTKTKANFGDNLKDTTPVGQFGEAGRSPYGLDDMAGNVWEWTSSDLKPYPYVATDGRESLFSSMKVRRGGAFTSPWPRMRLVYRPRDSTDMAANNYGFRVAATLP